MERSRRLMFDKVSDAIWGPRFAAQPGWSARLVGLIRLVLTLIRDLWAGELNLRAMSLAYVTLVSVVPMLALSFAVLKAFGVHQQMEPMLNNILAPLGEGGVEVTRHIVEFISATNVGVLGMVGFAFLLYTAVTLVQQIEAAFNAIWRIERARGIGEQFVRYLSAVLVGPFLLFVALGVAAVVMNQDLVQGLLRMGPFDHLHGWIGRFTPGVVVIVTLTFIYSFIPNARVRFGVALLGGLTAGVLWQLAGWMFSIFVRGSTSYAAIYSGFAVLILFMLWVYLSWFIVLLGASIAFYAQHPRHVAGSRANWRLSNRMWERLALLVMALIAQDHVDGRKRWSLVALSEALVVPAIAIDEIVKTLERAGFLAQTNDDPPVFLPVRDMSVISIAEVVDAVRRHGESRYLQPGALPVPAAVERVITAMDAGMTQPLADLTVKNLLDAPPSTADVPPAR